MSVAYGVVHALGGRVEVDSEVGRGTRVLIELPAAGATLGSPASAGRGRILLVDDDSDVARVVQRTLGGRHDVVIHSDPRKALDWLARTPQVDLVLCDLLIADPAGAEFHATVARDAPDLASRIVFLTTGATTRTARRFLDRVKTPLLDKPIDADALRAVVRNLLE
jgi:DNA-binding NtrC family response regulator